MFVKNDGFPSLCILDNLAPWSSQLSEIVPISRAVAGEKMFARSFDILILWIR